MLPAAALLLLLLLVSSAGSRFCTCMHPACRNYLDAGPQARPVPSGTFGPSEQYLWISAVGVCNENFRFCRKRIASHAGPGAGPLAVLYDIYKYR